VTDDTPPDPGAAPGSGAFPAPPGSGAAPGAPGDGAAPGPVGQLPAPPPGYVWAYPPPPPDPPWRAPRWLKITTVVWAVLLLVGGILYALHGRPSVREQTTIGNARPVVDRAIVDVVTAAGGAPVVAVSGFQRISSCSITPVRSGVEYKRAVDLYVSPGSEAAVLDTIARGLPHNYGASAGTAGTLTFYADAGDYVAVTGTVAAPGQIRIQALTGCRPATGADAAEPPAPANSPQLAAMGPAVAALGAPPPSAVTVADLACPSGTMRTVQATLAGSAPKSLATTLGQLSTAPAAASPATFAYRNGPVDLVVHTHDGTVTITATTRCGG
jgi:hypothetical protein